MLTMAQIFINKSEIKSNVESIIVFLEGRFGEVPQTIQDAVTQITDPTVLKKLALLAGKCKSPAEFKRALKT